MTKGHAKFPPSAAHRWFECPGSVALSEMVPEQPDTVYSIEGTRAHAVAAYCLTKRTPAALVKNFDGAPVDEEMREHVQGYVDTVRWLEELSSGGDLFVEQRVTVVPVVYGTADAIIVAGDRKSLDIVDLKYGAGVVVDVDRNEQLEIYALGALAGLPDLPSLVGTVETVRLHVYQPRAPGQKWRQSTVTREQLGETFTRMQRALADAQKSPAVLKPGDHCRWCPAKAVCPALRKESLELAQRAFAPAPDVTGLPPEELTKLLAAFPRVLDWIRAVTDHAQAVAKVTPIPGFKLVQSQGNRKWIDETTAADTLQHRGVDPWVEPKIISPAEAERRLKKAKADTDLSDLTVRPLSGATLVPEADPRPAVGGVSPFTPIEG